jgi:hypothetical protein
MKKRLIYIVRLVSFVIGTLLFILLFVVYGIYPAPNHERNQQRLIQWGHDTPRLQQITQYTEQLDNLPFDGLVFDIAMPNDRRGLSWMVFREPIDDALLDDIRDQFNDYDWGQLTDNFLRVNIFNTELRWEDWDIGLANLRKITALAQDLGFMGIMLDTEQYGAVDLFDYPAQNTKDSRSFDAYSELVFQGGVDAMQAIQSGYPDITVIYTLGITHRIAWLDSPPLDQHRYGLLVPFIEGMINTADSSVTLIDGYESSYVYRTEQEFATAYKWIRGGVSTQLADGDRYRDKMQAGFGLWIDPYCGEGGLPDNGCGFTPDEFDTALSLALRYSDRYVWLYNEHIDWFEDEGIPSSWWQTINQFKR